VSGNPYPYWGIDKSACHSDSQSAGDSPNGLNYPRNSIRYMKMSSGVDLRGVVSAQLTYWTQYQVVNTKDNCNVEVSVDGGINWQLLESYTSSSNWTMHVVSLNDVLDHPDVRVRFTLQSDQGNKEGWNIDDVTISRQAAPVHDAGTAEILSPFGNVPVGDSVTPTATFVNLGNQPETAPVRFVISNGGCQVYLDSGLVNLPVNACTTVTFRKWRAWPFGQFYHAKAWTALARDTMRQNDTAFADFSVMAGARDVGVTEVIAPPGLVQPGPLLPSCRVRNFGTEDESFEVRCWIVGPDTVYTGMDSVFSLAPGQSGVASFDVWSAVPGNYRVAFRTRCLTDVGPANDSLSSGLTVTRPAHDVGACLVVQPHGQTLPGTVAPIGVVRNYGSRTESFTARFRILDSLMAPVYSDSVRVLNLLPDNITLATFPLWSSHTGSYVVECLTDLNGDLTRDNDTVREGLVVTDDTTGSFAYGWFKRCMVPYGPKGKRVKDGGAVTALMLSDTPLVYGLKGNGTPEFYLYNVAGDTWLPRESLPMVTGKKGVKKSGTLGAADGRVYATRGNKTLEFWQYDPLAEPGTRWTRKADVPTGARALTEGTGMAAVRVGDTSFVYLLKSSKTLEFYRYNTLLNTWATMASAPLGVSGKEYRNGSGLTFDGAATIYALKSNYNEFFAYRVDSNLWRTRAPLPLFGPSGKKKKVKDGAGLAAYTDTRIYAQKGGNSLEWWCYYADSNKWFPRESYPVNTGKRVKAGGSLTRLPGTNRFFSLKGNNTLEFYEYVAADTVSVVSAAPARSGAELADVSPYRSVSMAVRPNPFALSTALTITLSQPGYVRVKLYDLAGGLRRTLVSSAYPAGCHTVALPRAGLASGVYLLKLDSGERSLTRKLVVE
jgi:hypothetical protein